MPAVFPATQVAMEDALAQPAVPAILVVDDEDTVRHLLVRWLEASGYTASSARGADEALMRLETSPAAVVLCDIRMPGHDGLWLASRIRQRHPETAVIISSGVHDVEASTESARQGVVDYLLKPFGRDRLREAVGRAVDWHASAWDARRWREALRRDMDALKASLWDRVRARPVTSDADLEALLEALTESAPDLRDHGRRVSEWSVAIAGEMGADELDLRALGRAALLHDLGKLAVPDAVLRKPAPLTLDELALVRAVPHLTADVLAAVPFLASAAPMVRDAFERVDGHGYPRGLRGQAVPLASRIIAVADAYDTMTHARVYRDPIPHQEALLELERCAGAQFDRAAVQAFERATAQIPRIN